MTNTTTFIPGLNEQPNTIDRHPVASKMLVHTRAGVKALTFAAYSRAHKS